MRLGLRPHHWQAGKKNGAGKRRPCRPLPVAELRRCSGRVLAVLSLALAVAGGPGPGSPGGMGPWPPVAPVAAWHRPRALLAVRVLSLAESGVACQCQCVRHPVGCRARKAAGPLRALRSPRVSPALCQRRPNSTRSSKPRQLQYCHGTLSGSASGGRLGSGHHINGACQVQVPSPKFHDANIHEGGWVSCSILRVILILTRILIQRLFDSESDSDSELESDSASLPGSVQVCFQQETTEGNLEGHTIGSM